MGRFVVLLRGVNVGGHNRMAMQALRDLLAGIGGTNVRTYLQSGNAVVDRPGSASALAAAVRERLQQDLGLQVDVMVRTPQEIEQVVAGNPFPDEQLDPKLLHAVFLEGATPQLDLEALLPDRVVPGSRVLYVAYAKDAHSSKAAALLNGKRLPVSATSRNWRTVLALRDLAAAPG